MIKKTGGALIYGLWALAAIVIFLFVIKKDYKAEYFGEMAKVKIEKQMNAEQKTMLDWYAGRMKEIILKLEDKDVEIALIGADAKGWYAKSVAANKKIATLLTCNEQLEAKNTLLVECQNYVLELNQNYQNGVEELGDLWGQKFALNLRELGELRLVNKNLIVRVGSLVKENVILESTKRNRLNLAIFGGIDLLHKDFAAGIGLSFNIFPIKFGLF